MRRVLTFLGLVFALSAPIWLLGWLAGVRLTPDLPLSAIVFVVPGIAAVISARRDGGRAAVAALLRRAVDWRVVGHRTWFLVAVFLPFGITALSLAVMSARGEPLPTPQFPVLVSVASLLVYLVAGAFEELGWTGYATDPLLQRRHALTAALFLGVVMMAFHVVQLVQHGRPAAWIAWWCLSTVTLRVLQVWLYANTRSVSAVVLMHAMINMSSIGPFLYYGPEGLSLEAQRASAIVTAVVAAVVVWQWGWRTLAEFRWRQARQVGRGASWPDGRGGIGSGGPRARLTSGGPSRAPTRLCNHGRMIERHGQGAYFHQVVEANGTLYLAGVVAGDLSAGMGGQTEQTLARIDEVLAGVGSDRSRIVSATIYITDMALKDEMNAVWAQWTSPEHRPARATVAVADLGQGVLIEISCVAVR